MNDADSVIGNESVTDLSFDGTTLTLTQDGAGNETVDLSSINADNIYNTDDALTGNRLVTQGNFDLNFDSNTLVVSGNDNHVGVGLNNPQRGFHVAANDVVRFSRSSNSAGFVIDRFNGGINNTMASAFIGLNTSTVGEGEFFFANYNENVSGGGFTRWITFDIDTDQVTLNQYGSNTYTGTPTSVLAVEANGDLIELDPNTLGTDDQTASQVDSDTPVDVDGDGDTEATVEDVIQDIAPIVSKAARIFYPPSIAVDASTNGTFTIDLHAQYIAQFGSPTVGSTGAPTAVPTYAPNELYYYVTFADPAVFDTTSTSGPTQMQIDADGMLTYTIIAQPTDFNALINVVFVVK